MKPIAEQIFDLAQRLAENTPGFQNRIGPGGHAGNGVTNKFLRALDNAVHEKWGSDVCRQKEVAEGVKYTFDYFIPSEKTAVEVALSLRNSGSEFQKDIFKTILANEFGERVSRLVLIGKEGAVKRQNEPGPTAIKTWVRRSHGIEVVVMELLESKPYPEDQVSAL